MEDRITCLICPYACNLRKGDTGKCGIISNQNGEMKEIQYGSVSAANIEPIEKKPLYHFYPGSQTLSVGFYGCNMSCQYCQNSKFAHVASKNVNPNATWDPSYLVNMAISKSVPMICFTYTEPLIRINYLKSVYKLASKNGIKIVVSTNGLYHHDFWRQAIQYVDAINLDIKTPLVFCENPEEFDKSEFERKVLQIDRKYMIVKENLRIAFEAGIPIECSMLVVNSTYGNEEKINESAIMAAKKISEISRDIPVHLLKYFPVEKLDIDSTSDSMMNLVFEEYSKYLNYVYTDFGHLDKDTCCPSCGESVISRKSYRISISERMQGKTCKCGYEMPIIIRESEHAKI